MKKLLLIALLMLTIVFAAVACKDNTSKPADTTVEDGTTAEPTTTVAPETTAEPETTITETTAPETTAPETTVEETTVEETTAEETTAEETTAEETTAEETTAEETTVEETEPETVVVPENATNVALGAGVNASEAFIGGPWHPDALTDGIWTGVEADGPFGWINNVAGPTADEITIILTLQDVYVLYEASLYPAKGTGAATPGSDFPKAYELMVSEDGENWITVATDANVDATAASDAELQPKVYNFGKAVKAKYFAIKITEHSGQTHNSGPNGILPKTILGEIALMGLDAALFDVFESDPMAVKPADAIYHVYDILTTGDSIADYFAHDYIVANGFGIGLGVGAYYHQDAPFGSPVWYVIQNSAAALSKKMSRAYVYTVDIMIQDGGGALNNSGFFVRGSEALYTGSWAGQTGDNEGFGGSGIYFNVKQDANFAPTHLVITLKSDVQGEGNAMTFTETNIEIPVTSDRISVADDGDTLYVIADGTLLCTIDIVGTVAYADRGIEEGVIASKAVVTFVNGTTQTIENVACAADFGTLGIGARTVDSKQFTWTYVSVDLLENYDIPKFDKVTTDKKTYNAGEAINVTAMGFGTDVVALFLKADFEALDFAKAIYAYQIGFDSGKTVNILDTNANPAMFAYHTVPAGEYVVALVNAAGTVIDSKVITVVGSIDVENPGEDAGVVVVPDGAKDAADVNQNDKLTGDIATGLNLGGVWTIYKFVLTVDGEYELQVSVDGSAWTTVTLIEDGKLTAPVLAQYIRFEGNVTAVEIKATFLGEPETDPVPDENAPEIEDDFVEVPENATNVALDAYVFATEGFVVGPWHSDNLVDGLWSGTEKNGWISDVNSGVPSGDVTITLTLKEMSILYQVLLYPGKGSCLAGEKSGSDFPKAYEVMVSEDGIRWTTVAVATDVDATADSDDELKPVVHHFKKAIMAKYVAIKITEHCDVLFPSGFGPMPYSVLGEIKVTGTVVETEAPAPVEIPDNVTNVALGATVNATTSWTANPNFWDNSYLTDGSWLAIEGDNEKLGWRSSSQVALPLSDFTIILELDEVSTIYQAVLCPERFQSGMWFPKGYDMLVSMDGETWTVVESVTGVTVAPNSETDIPALTYTFDEAVTAKYFCLRITQHSGNTFNGGYGDIEVSAIGEIMLKGVAAN